MSDDPFRSSGTTRSLWADVEVPDGSSPLAERTVTDVVVVGAGISGLTTAYLLGRAGERVVVLDSGHVGSGETGRTTAHLTCALDDRFRRLEEVHGPARTRLAAESHAHAIDLVERIVLAERIDCAFRRLDGYLFLREGTPREELEEEGLAAVRAGLEVELLESPPGPALAPGPALRFPRQADFNPMQYLAGLARGIERMGGRIHAGEHVSHVDGGPPVEVHTERGAIVRARAVVLATNTPVTNRVVLHAKQSGYRTYAMTFDVPRGVIEPALRWDTGEAYHYVRLDHTMAAPGRELLVVGGEDHRVGQEQEPEERWDRLEAWTRERFAMAGVVVHRWSGQVLEPADGLAFIGHNPMDAPGVFVATGDSGNGMTHGTIAGSVLSELVRGRPHPYAELYEPRRRRVRALGEMARDAANVAVQYADWARPGDVESAADIPAGSGATVLERGHRVAVYRDEAGRCHRFSAACRHLGGVVCWNSAERSWDCPVHGARYDAYGRVIMGPAIDDLPPRAAPADGHDGEHEPSGPIPSTPRGRAPAR